MYEHEQLVTIDEKCINVVEKVYMLPGYDAFMAGSWEKHVAVYFKVVVQCNSSIGRQMQPC